MWRSMQRGELWPLDRGNQTALPQKNHLIRTRLNCNKSCTLTLDTHLVRVMPQVTGRRGPCAAFAVCQNAVAGTAVLCLYYFFLVQNKTNQIVPEFTVDLRGATISWASRDKSSKKNVLEVRGCVSRRYLKQVKRVFILHFTEYSCN